MINLPPEEKKSWINYLVDWLFGERRRNKEAQTIISDWYGV